MPDINLLCFFAGSSVHKLSTISIEPTCVPGSMQTNEDTVVALVSVSKVNRIPENETL